MTLIKVMTWNCLSSNCPNLRLTGYSYHQRHLKFIALLLLVYSLILSQYIFLYSPSLFSYTLLIYFLTLSQSILLYSPSLFSSSAAEVIQSVNIRQQSYPSEHQWYFRNNYGSDLTLHRFAGILLGEQRLPNATIVSSQQNY